MPEHIKCKKVPNQVLCTHIILEKAKFLFKAYHSVDFNAVPFMTTLYSFFIHVFKYTLNTLAIIWIKQKLKQNMANNKRVNTKIFLYLQNWNWGKSMIQSLTDGSRGGMSHETLRGSDTSKASSKKICTLHWTPGLKDQIFLK